MSLSRTQANQTDRWAHANVDAFVQGAGAASRVKSGSHAFTKRRPRPRPLPLETSGRTAVGAAPSASYSSTKTPLERLPRFTSTSTFASTTEDMGLSRNASSVQDAVSSTTSRWCEVMPAPILFPGNKPSSRADAAMLNQWVTGVLDSYAAKMAAGEEETTSLSQRVDELVPHLSLGLHELVQQVNKHCLERGVVLEKIWRTYVELFDRALAETRALLRYHKARTSRVNDQLQHTHGELHELEQKHPDQLAKLSRTLSAKFLQRQDELDATLKKVKHENAIMSKLIQTHTDTTRSWFPLFDKYKNSSFKDALMSAPAGLPATTTPESRLAADFKRILIAMPFEARRRVGFFVSSLLGLRGTELMDNPETVESLNERKEHNIWRIGLLEERIRELKGEIPEGGAAKALAGVL